MPVFEYLAVDGERGEQKGLIHGVDLEAARSALVSRGWDVQRIAAAVSVGDPLAENYGVVGAGASLGERGRGEGLIGGQAGGRVEEGPPLEARSRWETDLAGPLVGGVALRDLHFFFKQLSAMLGAGINPVQALDTLSSQSTSRKLQKVLREAREHVRVGRPMSAGFQRYPEVFSPIMMGMVRSGEEGGFLVEQCSRLSDYIQRDIELRNLIRRETFYPKAVVVASVFIILGANWIISYVSRSTGNAAMMLPAPTMFWTFLLLAAIGIFLWGRLALRQAGIKRAWDWFCVSLPWVGKMVHGFAMARFGRAFGALVESGMPLGRAFTLSADVCGNEHVRAQIYPAAWRLDSGEGVHKVFRETRAFSPIVLDMVQAGEMTGNMHEMLTKVSEYYEDEGQTKARQSATIIGVVALLMVGAYVLYVLVTFYTGYAGSRLEGL